MARQVQVSSTEELLESMKNEARQEALAELAPQVEELIGKCQEFLGGTPVVVAKGKPGRKPGRKPASVSAKSGPPKPEWGTEAGRGRKQCPNCSMYAAARSEVCPHCWYNFHTKKVMSYTDADGGVLKSPFQSKGKKAKVAKVAKVATKSAPKSDFGSKIADPDLDGFVKKSLGAKKDGLPFKEIMEKVTALAGLIGTPSRGFGMRVMHSLTRVASQDTETKNWRKGKAEAA
jgi:hypothetical protein